MIYVLYGPDQFRAHEELRAIREELDRDGALVHNTERLDGRSLTPAELRAACHTASLFGEDRLVIVEGLQARLGGARRRGRPRSSAEGGSDLDEFVSVLSQLPPSTTVVLMDEQVPRPLIDALGQTATVRQFPILRDGRREGNQLSQWVSQRARLRGAQLTPAALNRLVLLIDGAHLGELAQELDKLATYAGDRPIDVADIDALVSGALQFQVWDLTDAVVEGRADRALSVLQAMDEQDHPPQLLIFMLTRQYRQLTLAQAMLRDGLNEAQIGERLGLRDYPLRKLMRWASSFPATGLETAYRRLLATDVSVKTGVLDVATALRMLVVELAELARSPRRMPAR
jgi:DNA polymerase-3 subunit delta